MSEDTLAQDGGDTTENSVIKALRDAEAKAKAEAKRLSAELEGLQAERAQSREAQLEAAVNGRSYPEAVVSALKAQVETASADEFAKLLQDLGSVAPDTEGEQDETIQEEQSAPTPKPNPADLGQQIAAAAQGRGSEVDVIKKLATAESREDLLAAVSEHGLDKF